MRKPRSTARCLALTMLVLASLNFGGTLLTRSATVVEGRATSSDGWALVSSRRNPGARTSSMTAVNSSSNIPSPPGPDESLAQVSAPGADGKIAFSRSQSIAEFHVINPDGSNQTSLNNGQGLDGTPAWSPDGTRIAFTRNSDIYVMNADGSNSTRLTNDPAWDFEPDWSPDGARIVFTRVRVVDDFSTGADYGIYLMNADGSNQTRLTNNPARDSEPAWSPDGARIAFTSRRNGNDENRNDEIYVMNANGSNQVRLTNNSASDFEPAWSPDGARILFTNLQVINSEIYVMNADGSSQANLSNNPAHDSEPAWSPDGTRIAFASHRDGNLEIYVMNADGGSQINLSNNPAHDSEPAWSPDGTRIAFTSHRDGRSQIFVMNADGNNQRRLTSSEHDSEPAWSPDGTRIAFRRYAEVYVMSADGSNQTRLTNTQFPFFSSEPTWSPDGSRIAFNRGRDINDQLIPDEVYVMNADGSNGVNLTNNPAVSEGGPAWSPDGSRIAFTRRFNVYVMNVDGSNQTILTNIPGALDALADWQALPPTTPIDDPTFFVLQHYLDFLNRPADDLGLAFWTNQITECGTDATCIEGKRVHVSAAFFLSIEFQETGYLVHRMYKAAYGDMPGTLLPLTRQEFLPDTQQVGQGVVVNAPGWELTLENNKNLFASEFVARSRFTTAFPQAMTAEQFVDTLNANASGALSPDGRDQLVTELASGAKTRAQVLRSVAEDADLARKEFNRAFVLMQYFGYLRRNPNDAPDLNFVGYDFWLNKLNQFNGNFVQAEMVKAFINSGEYRQRFGQP